MLAVERTIISQYSASPTLTQLIAAFNEFLDPSVNFETFYNYVWNIDTAQGFGLDIWGRIVDVGRVLQVPSSELRLGFEEASPTSNTFNNGTFFGGSGATDNFSLSDEAYRTLILAKAFANICDGSTPAINQVLLSLFPDRGNAYVTDGLDMTMTYTFEFPLSVVEYAIVTQSGVLPKPAGVVATVEVP